MGREPNKLLTEVELEMMQVLWKNKGATVSEVKEALSSKRKLAYTSISTILRILEQKSIVRAQKEGRGHRYVPVMDKEEFESKSVQHLVSQVFEGTPSALVRRLIDDRGLSSKDLRDLHSLLEQRLQS